jgi:hypothetical protein
MATPAVATSKQELKRREEGQMGMGDHLKWLASHIVGTMRIGPLGRPNLRVLSKPARKRDATFQGSGKRG